MNAPYWMHVLPGGAPGVLELGGEIDQDTAGKLRGRLLALPAVDVVLDLSEVRFLGVGGLNLLLQLRARLAETGHTVYLAAVPRQARRLIGLAELEGSLPCWLSVDEARAAAAATGGTTPSRTPEKPCNRTLPPPQRPETRQPRVREQAEPFGS